VGNPARAGLGVEVRDPAGRLQYTVRMFPSGLVAFEPGAAETILIDQCRLDYAIEPSLIGEDLVFDPRSYPGTERLYVPSSGFLTGLIDGGDAMLVAAWPPGGQGVELGLTDSAGRRLVDGISIAAAGQALYLQSIEQPDVWHAEQLQPAYLEKDTVIGWKRPLEAKWIGRFFVASEEIHYPFYSLYEKRRLWGRYIRGWYDYPLWFDGDKTCVFFEKKFPPEGELLIYFLETDGKTRPVRSPVEVLEEALGKDAAAGLLDLDGVNERPLLAHHEAVCAMTNNMQKLFDDGQEVQQKTYIASRADDVADFIKMIRQRVFEYADFARQMKQLLAERGQAYSAETLNALDEIVDEIAVAAVEDLPDVSLEEVRQWTDEIKRLAAEVRSANAGRYGELAKKCRSVAGGQDDLARELSILTIRLMETAAARGVHSPQQAALTQEIVARSRQILRHPTWWEPRRFYSPKSNPGAP
jgi:hypothetical protein